MSAEISGPTILGLLAAQDAARGSAPAILAPGRDPVSYAQLRTGIDRAGTALAMHGLGRGHRIATALADGRDAGLAMLAAMAWSTCVPLDRRLAADAAAALLARLRVDALIAAEGDQAPVIAAAGVAGLRVLRLGAGTGADLVTLRAEVPGAAVARRPACSDDGALVVHTSGTTAIPKVVPITQRALLVVGEAHAIGSGDRCLCISPLHTTSGLGYGLIVPLKAGASTVLTPGFDVARFFDWLAAYRPTYFSASPTVYAAIIDEIERRRPALPTSLRFVRSSSNGMSSAMQERLEAALQVPVIQGYGSTEAGLIAQDSPLPGRRRAGSVGTAAGTEIMIVDEQDRPLPTGASGEIMVRGPGVMRGYENDAEANRRAFHQGWFRTGDLGRLDADGYLYLTGRIKELINRGGLKVAPGEVDAVFLQHPGVHDAATVGLPHPLLGENVVTAVVRSPGAAVDAQQLREHALRQLVPHKVPSSVVFVDDLPRNALGKVLRHELADLLQKTLRADFLPPRDAEEAAVAAIFAALLDLPRVGALDNFFELGGDSLRGAQVLSRVGALLGIEVDPATLFEAPTVAQFAARLRRAKVAAPPPAANAPRLVRRARGRADAAGAGADASRMASAPTHGATGAEYMAIASFGQQRLWLVDRLLADKAVYNEPWVDRLTGPLDVAALERALGEIVARHDILRTSFAVIDGRLQQVVGPVSPLALAVEDLAGLPAPAREARARVAAQEEIGLPFDLERGPPIRAKLLRLEPQEHWLVLTLHHIVFDRWSAAVFARELAALYGAFKRGLPSPLAPLPVCFADYAEWQRQFVAGDRQAQLLAYWEAALAGLPTLALPTDRPRPAVATMRGGHVDFAIGAELTAALKELARREHATLFMVLLAAFQVLLHRWSGQDDIAVGVPVAGRTQPELEALIGFFVNMLVVRGDLSGDPPFHAYLARVRRITLDAYAHGDLPFETLVERLGPRRDLARNPLYQVSFRLGNTPALGLRLPDLVTRRVDAVRQTTAKFDLSIAVNEHAGRLTMRAEYMADLFDAATVERMADHYRTLLASIASAPAQCIDRLPLHGAAERARLLAVAKGRASPYPEARCVHRLVEAVAARAPASVAVVDGERTVSYGELDARANRLAHLLRQRASGTAPRIGLCLERGVDLVVAMLAILKAGGAYVPLDPELPAERLAFILQDAGVCLLVAASSLLPRIPWTSDRVLCVDRDAALIAAQPMDDHDAPEASTQLAYVMYTSGSSGTPKGVLIPHRAIARLVCGTDYVRIDASDALAHAANPAFDAATFEVWGALANGARVVVVPRLTALAPKAFAAMLERAGVTVLFLTTALFNQMAQAAPAAFGGCRTVLFGGEAVEPRWVRAVLDAAPPAHLVHVYGPTETTTFATWHEVHSVPADAITIPIGRPIANTEVYVLDAQREPVPVGLPGELYIGGPGVAMGYLDRPELSAERFVPHPFVAGPPSTLYRTGDRVRMRADDAIEFIGRLDRQVKIRGHRIELEEVEAAIARLPEVREAAVVLRGETAEARQLVAYVVAATSSGPPPATLRADLKRLLPDYMIPASVVWLKSLPMTASGKIDRLALPAANQPGTQRGGARVAPRDMFEQVLCGIWARLLDVDDVGVTDHFFDLGGHSLLAARLIDEVERETGVAAPLAALFADDTVAGFARLLREGTAGVEAPVVTINGGGSRVPLVFLHGDLTGGGFYSRALARALGPDQPVLVVHPHLLDGAPIPDTIEAMAADRLRALRALRAHGPYCLAGYCNGALVAFEMARQLVATGDEVPMVVAIQARAPRGAAAAPATADGQYVVFDGAGVRVLVPHDRESDLLLRYSQAIDAYRGGNYAGRLVLIRAHAPAAGPRDFGWSRFAPRIEVHVLPGDHVTLVTRHVGALAQVIRGAMASIGAPAGA